MKMITILVLACVLSACEMTPKEKKWVEIGVAVLVVGAAIEIADGNHHRKCDNCGHLVEIPFP